MQTCKIAILQLVAGIIVIAIVIAFNYQFLYDFYIAKQETLAGPIINGFILVLFVTGLLGIVQNLGYYARQEAAIRQFRRNLTREIDEPDEGIPSSALIAQRYTRIQELSHQHVMVDQNALAAALLAQQSLKTSYPRYINNILILAGVFGTIISLSIALVGADQMLGDSSPVSGMTTVIHGMSTALSTTMTAIFCYVFFHFFYSKLTDIQTNIVSQIEDITQTQLNARTIVTEGDLLRSTNRMLQMMQALLEEMKQTQQKFSHAGTLLATQLGRGQQESENISQHMDRLEALLREGFRLPENR
jgi:hypothetical protein